jgi:hypothetical protein
LKRQKSISSQAASISAWNTVLLWLSMVAALRVARQVVASSSAALRNTAARSSQGQADHSRWAAAAAATACSTSAGDAWWNSPSTWAWSCGITAGEVRPVRTSRPPTTRGISTRSPAMARRRAFSSAFSGDPGP